MSHDDILTRYSDGMREAHRVLRPGDLLWVKCADEIESRPPDAPGVRDRNRYWPPSAERQNL
jgi:hypothetical protein